MKLFALWLSSTEEVCLKSHLWYARQSLKSLLQLSELACFCLECLAVRLSSKQLSQDVALLFEIPERGKDKRKQVVKGVNQTTDVAEVV